MPTSRPRVRDLPVGDDTLAVDEDVADADGIAVGILESRDVTDRVWIEDRDICFHPRSQRSAIGEERTGGRQ